MQQALCGATLQGVDAYMIWVEVDLMRRLPGVSIVGLATSAVKESIERIRSAIGASAMVFPRKRVIVNLAPAHLKKEGTGLDLPIALAILATQQHVDPAQCAQFLAVGELGLGGQVRSVSGVLAYAELAMKHNKTLLIAHPDLPLARKLPGLKAVGVHHLTDAFRALQDTRPVPPAPSSNTSLHRDYTHDLTQVFGQPLARLALEVAAAGGHHVLMMGAPGSGKSLLAKCLPSILPKMTLLESLEVSRIHGARGGGASKSLLMSDRPFRSPHHSLSIAGLIGDRHLRPGELCLAHRGVLFLDEATEFPRHLLECLRQPLQDNSLQLTRAAGTVTYPCAFSLVLAANPCPCGWYGSGTRCVCSTKAQMRYLQKLSGPMLDRIDLRVWMDAPVAIPSRGTPTPECSQTVRERVDRAVATQRARGQVNRNAQTHPEDILSPHANHEAHDALENQVLRSASTFRARDSMVRVARTLADLEGETDMGARHIHQAAELRGAPFLR